MFRQKNLVLILFAVVTISSCRPNEYLPVNPNEAGACVVGRQVTCPCPDGAIDAVQVCIEEGVFGECSCGPAAILPSGGATVVAENVVVSEDVEVLDEALMAQSSVEDDRIVFPLSARTQVVEGKVLVSGTETGLLRRVVSIEETSENLIAMTEAGSLEEVFESAKVSISMGTSRADPLFAGFEEVGYDIGGTVLFQEGGTLLEISRGSLGFNPSFDSDFDISGGRLDSFSVSGQGIVSGELVLHLDVDEQRQESGQAIIFEGARRTAFFVGFVPVVAVIRLRLEAGYELDVDAQVDIEAGVSAWVTPGFEVNYEDEAFSSTADITTNLDIVGPTFMSAGGVAARIYLQPTVSIDFYTLGGPAVQPEVWWRGDLSVADPLCDWSMYGGATVDVTAELKFLSKTLADYSTRLYEEEKLLYSAADWSEYATRCPQPCVGPDCDVLNPDGGPLLRDGGPLLDDGGPLLDDGGPLLNDDSGPLLNDDGGPLLNDDGGPLLDDAGPLPDPEALYFYPVTLDATALPIAGFESIAAAVYVDAGDPLVERMLGTDRVLRAENASGDLPIEVEHLDGSGALIWVRLDANAAAEPFSLVVWGPGAESNAVGAVWTDHQAVLHMAGAGDSSPIGWRNIANVGPSPDADCPMGTCLRFDGENDHIDLLNAQNEGPPWLMGVSAYTISVWAKKVSVEPISAEIVSLSTGAPNPVSSSRATLSYQGGSLRGILRAPDNGPSYVSDAIEIPDDEWHHLAAVVAFPDAAGGNVELRLFVDGVEATYTRGPLFVAPQTATDVSVPQIATIGSNDRGTAAFFQGSLDEIRILPRALSPAEMAADIASVQPGFATIGTEQLP